MKQTFTLKEKIAQLWHLFLPILITQLAMLLMNFFDTTMSGHFSKADLAGVAIGASLWFPVSTGLGTVLQAVTPIISHLIGSKNTDEIPRTFIQSLYVAVCMAVLAVCRRAIDRAGPWPDGFSTACGEGRASVFICPVLRADSVVLLPGLPLAD